MGATPWGSCGVAPRSERRPVSSDRGGPPSARGIDGLPGPSQIRRGVRAPTPSPRPPGGLHFEVGEVVSCGASGRHPPLLPSAPPAQVLARRRPPRRSLVRRTRVCPSLRRGAHAMNPLPSRAELRPADTPADGRSAPPAPAARPRAGPARGLPPRAPLPRLPLATRRASRPDGGRPVGGLESALRARLGGREKRAPRSPPSAAPHRESGRSESAGALAPAGRRSPPKGRRVTGAPLRSRRVRLEDRRGSPLYTAHLNEQGARDMRSGRRDRGGPSRPRRSTRTR